MAAAFAGELRTVGFALILLVTPAALAEPKPGMPVETTPPVEQASFHQLVFADDDIGVLNNLYPPGGDSGFHAHYRDLFYVVIQSQPQRSQRPGQPLAAAPLAPVGAAGYSPIGAGPRVHRVVNGDTGISQFIVVELRRASPLGNAMSSREAASQYVPIVDNPRMRAWRLILEPGASVPAISQAGTGVRIVVRGGLLTTTMPGAPDQTLALRPGDFAVQKAGLIRALRNAGTETIELVEMELK